MQRKFAFGMTVHELNVFTVNTEWAQETAAELIKS
jgi:hypothetical protein